VTTSKRRMEMLEGALSPTEAVVRWLEAAKGYGSFGAYAQYLMAHGEQSPAATIPPVVAAWAGHEAGKRNDRAATERTDRAVRAALVRVFLVERMNWMLAWRETADAKVLDLLEALRPLVLTGRADQSSTACSVAHLGQLLLETRVWQRTAQVIGTHFLAGSSPLFPDLEAELAATRMRCEQHLTDYTTAVNRVQRTTLKGEPVDVAGIVAQAEALVEAHVHELAKGARVRMETFLAERSGIFAIERLTYGTGWSA
jgi:hypothetical protein